MKFKLALLVVAVAALSGCKKMISTVVQPIFSKIWHSAF